jgi:hypothetical protein
MYRKGLTAARIANLCAAIPQTVSRHLRVQRENYPEMLVEHLANRPANKPRPPSAAWMANVDAVSAFRRAHGRYPTTRDSDPAHRKLARWLSLQRHDNRAGVLPEDRRQILGCLPGWDSNQRAELHAERWEIRFEQLRTFRAAEGRWPRLRDPADGTERLLGVWLHAQRQAFGAGRLTSAEVKLLDAKVRGWNVWRLKHLATLAARSEPVSGSHG